MLRGSVGIVAGANYVSFFQAESLPGSGITGPAQLAGKTVAVNLTNNAQTLTLDTVLKADKAAQLQPVETPVLSAGMLKSPLQVSSLIMP